MRLGFGMLDRVERITVELKLGYWVVSLATDTLSEKWPDIEFRRARELVGFVTGLEQLLGRGFLLLHGATSSGFSFYEASMFRKNYGHQLDDEIIPCDDWEETLRNATVS